MRMYRHALALNAFSIVLAATAAEAHHPGGPGNTGGAGPINTISATTLKQGAFAAGIVVDTMNLERLGDATLVGAAEQAEEAGTGHAHVHSLDSLTSASLFFAYGITKNITLSVRLPHVRRKGIREAEEEHGDEHEEEHAEFAAHNDGDTSGIGDLTALAQWRIVNDRASGFEAAVIAGFKAPTGKTSERTNEGALFDAEFQPGSGSWDALFGAALTKRIARWSLDASVLYSLVSEGVQRTDLGDRLGYGLAVSYRLIGNEPQHGNPASHSNEHADGHAHGENHHHIEPAASHENGFSVDAILEIVGEWQDEHETAGVKDPNSGGHVMFISPGVRLSRDAWSGFISVGIPVVNDLNGIQSEPEWRLTAGSSVAF